MEAQQQNSSVDCGLFLIAFTSCLAYYNDTEKLAFKPELITTQILKCFKNKYVTQFSSTTKRIKKCRSMTSAVKLYCICRLPYDAKWDTTQCDYCKQWYHWGHEKTNSLKKVTMKSWYCSLFVSNKTILGKSVFA